VAIAKVIARLNEGVAAASARDRVLGATALKGQAAAAVQVAPLREALVGAVRPIALAVWIAAGLVLLVACINAANLLLARVARRQREFAVRRALGATRGRLIRQVVLESLVLSALGALASIPAAIWTLQAARVLLPATLHGVADLGIDGRTIFAAGGLALVATLLFGFGPSLSIRPLSSADAVHAAAPGGDRFWRRVRSGLLVAEIAIALVLLAGATALVQEIREVMAIDIGVRGERALAIELSLPRATYRTVDDHRAFFARADEVLRAVPGVEEVGVTSQLPGRAPALLVVQHVAIEGHAPAAAERHDALLLTASPGYFAAAGIDLIAGRAFTNGDRPGTESVVIVSESFARLLDLQPAQLIGARVPSQDAAATIVGVVRDVRLQGPERPFAPALYVPHVVDPRTSGPVYLVIRAAADPVALVPAIRSAVARIDADLALYNIRSFDEIRAVLLTERRLAMITMVVFAGLAFILSAIGLYGVVSYLVQARTREIGIRLAIGASRPAVCRGVLWSGAGHALAGVGLGIAASLAVTTLVASRLPALGRVSFESVAWLAVMLVAVALLATVLPAWRASRIDPAVTLRAE
jgi:putative ABC transport system permease protein